MGMMLLFVHLLHERVWSTSFWNVPGAGATAGNRQRYLPLRCFYANPSGQHCANAECDDVHQQENNPGKGLERTVGIASPPVVSTTREAMLGAIRNGERKELNQPRVRPGRTFQAQGQQVPRTRGRAVRA